MYVKSKLRTAHFHNPTLNTMDDSEQLIIELEQREMMLGCIYRSPSLNSDRFFSITDTFNLLSDTPVGLKLIAGDSNAPGICIRSLVTSRLTGIWYV